MTPKLYKAAEVCEIAQLQPYVLRSWEKEFPGIGVQKSPDGPRLYRQADVDQVLRIKQLVFGEGLTLAGARRRLEETAPAHVESPEPQLPDAFDTLASDARMRIARVRDGLRSLLTQLSNAPGSVADGYRLEPPPTEPVAAKVRGRSKTAMLATGAEREAAAVAKRKPVSV